MSDPVRPADDMERVIHTHGSALLRICLMMLGNAADAEDAVQDTFIRCMNARRPFESQEHLRAWLITVAVNRCRDALRYRKRHPQVDIDAIPVYASEPADSAILEAMLRLPDKLRIALLLHYVEDLRVNDIARMLSITPSAVKMRLKKGRALLEELYRKEFM